MKVKKGRKIVEDGQRFKGGDILLVPKSRAKQLLAFAEILEEERVSNTMIDPQTHHVRR